MPDPLDPAALDLASDPELGPLLAAHPDIALLRFRDGERLVVEGEESQDLFIVRKGSLVVEKALPDGTARPLAQIECAPETPTIIGEMAYFGAQRRTATVRAVGACQALHLKPAHLDAIMEGFPNLTRILCHQFTARLKEANDELRELRTRFHLAPERRMVETGEVIFEAGSKADALFQVAMGTVRVGDRLLRAEDLSGGFLELEAYLRQRPHEATVVAEETCFLAVIPASARAAFVRTHPDLVLEILRA
ncbi:Crp/Fnr family transcriptional regulator [Geothrix sp. 21YS21S-4]|uniref:Crp/Fnr family transcriptional regulator n=1 Tax=Geothrix sp. 21YS21S-4 TaxID=3068889 RepID=UPI0027BABD5C|nr:cyclic nucleotide-binding domain-containing protein [Geothrix sp. 21YS21S-4]